MPVVITGALGRVGRTALWVAKKLSAHVIAGVRGSQKKAAEELGADALLALDSREEVDALGLVDVVADTIGGAVSDALLGKVKQGGVYALSGRCSYCGKAGEILTARIGTNGRRRNRRFRGVIPKIACKRPSMSEGLLSPSEFPLLS